MNTARNISNTSYRYQYIAYRYVYARITTVII